MISCYYILILFSEFEYSGYSFTSCLWQSACIYLCGTKAEMSIGRAEEIEHKA